MADPHDALEGAETPARPEPAPAPPSETVELEVGALEATLPAGPETTPTRERRAAERPPAPGTEAGTAHTPTPAPGDLP
jgi:hypothetical protein